MGTIRANLERDVYPTIEALESDVYQMLDNCYKFNPPENHVHVSGKAFEELFRSAIAKVKAEMSKKRSSEKSGGSSSKKMKYM